MQLYYGKSKTGNVDGSSCDIYLNVNREFNGCTRRPFFYKSRQGWVVF